MNKVKRSNKNFITVRDILHNAGELSAHRLSWTKPRLFYLEHSKTESLRILRAEAAARDTS